LDKNYCLFTILLPAIPSCDCSLQFKAAIAKLRAEKDKEIAAQAEVIDEFNKKAKIMQVSAGMRLLSTKSVCLSLDWMSFPSVCLTMSSDGHNIWKMCQDH